MKPLTVLAVTAGIVQSLRPTLVPRTTTHQAMVTAACVGTAGLLATPIPRTSWHVGKWVVPAGVALGLVRGTAHAKAQSRSHPQWEPRTQNSVVATAAGASAGVLVAHGPRLAYACVRWGGNRASLRFSGSPAVWSGIVALGAGAGLAGCAALVARVGLHTLREVGIAADPALRLPPADPHVSGGPASGIDYSTLARDGRRFVSLRTPAEQIRPICGQAVEPIRVYVGLHSAPTTEQRVDLAVAELERLGAFRQGNLFIMSPAGSGYAELVAADAVECLTAGDCATVVVQYGVLPSVLSLRRVELGARTVRLLLDRLSDRLEAMPAPPRVVMYGESLGARVAQEALALPPRRTHSDGRVDSLDALVSVGTPGGPSLRNEALNNPGVVHLDSWQDLRGDERAHLWFLDHDADPVTRWEGALAWRFPTWLRRPRGRGIPESMNWVPILTWWQVVFDLVFAAQQQSGQFRSIGHDYRADLAAVLAQVFDAGTSVSSVIGLLERREVERDRLLAEHTASSLPH